MLYRCWRCKCTRSEGKTNSFVLASWQDLFWSWPARNRDQLGVWSGANGVGGDSCFVQGGADAPPGVLHIVVARTSGEIVQRGTAAIIRESGAAGGPPRILTAAHVVGPAIEVPAAHTLRMLLPNGYEVGTARVIALAEPWNAALLNDASRRDLAVLEMTSFRGPGGTGRLWRVGWLRACHGAAGRQHPARPLQRACGHGAGRFRLAGAGPRRPAAWSGDEGAGSRRLARRRPGRTHHPGLGRAHLGRSADQQPGRGRADFQLSHPCRAGRRGRACPGGPQARRHAASSTPRCRVFRSCAASSIMRPWPRCPCRPAPKPWPGWRRPSGTARCDVPPLAWHAATGQATLPSLICH